MILKYFSDNLCPGSTFAAYSPPIEMQGAYHLINSGLRRMKRKLIGIFLGLFEIRGISVCLLDLKKFHHFSACHRVQTIQLVLQKNPLHSCLHLRAFFKYVVFKY